MRDVGVVIPTLGDRPAWLEVCLDSVRAQSGELQLVVVAPRTSEMQAVCDKYRAHFVPDPQRGLSGAINVGFESLGDVAYKTWLGDDDILAPHALTRARNALENSPEAAFAFGRTRYINADGSPIYTGITGRWAPYYLRFGQDYIPQPGSLLRNAAITWTPPLNETLKNAMDLDLFLRLSKPGRSSWVYIAEELSAYRIHGGAITQTKGFGDESARVRADYSILGRIGNAPLVRDVRKFLERVFVYVQWHRRKPASWVSAGPWTQPQRVVRS